MTGDTITYSPIGLSLVELVWIDGNALHFKGVDILDGRPLLDGGSNS